MHLVPYRIRHDKLRIYGQKKTVPKCRLGNGCDGWQERIVLVQFLRETGLDNIPDWKVSGNFPD